MRQCYLFQRCHNVATTLLQRCVRRTPQSSRPRARLRGAVLAPTGSDGRLPDGRQLVVVRAGARVELERRGAARRQPALLLLPLVGDHADDLRADHARRHRWQPARHLRDYVEARHADRRQPAAAQPRRRRHRLPRHLRAVHRLQVLRRHVGVRGPLLQGGAVLALRHRLRHRLHARRHIGAALSDDRVQVCSERFDW